MPPSCQTPEDCFSLFFGDTMLQYLVDTTNAYADKKLSTMTVSDRSLYRNWRPVTVEEMKGFFAIILNMGIIQLNNLKDYWSTDDTTNFPFFRSVFSRDRFFQIFGMLYVGDPDSSTRCAKIQPFIDLLCPVFESTYTPSQQIAVDESVISFKGRVSFRQYLKGKPHPWGMKAFVMSDGKTGYLQRVCVYYGKETRLIDNNNPHTTQVVQTLVEPYHNKGYDLYVDRFYSSPFLATELNKVGITVTSNIFIISCRKNICCKIKLLSFQIHVKYLVFKHGEYQQKLFSNKLYFLTGTVQSNRRGLPREVTVKRKDPRGTIRAARSGSILALSWVDKRTVLMISTKHNASKTVVRTRYIHFLLKSQI